MNGETPLDDALSAMTDALMNGPGEAGLRRAARAYDRGQVEPFVPLLLSLRDAYEPVEPSARFIRQLHEDLIGEPERGLIGRARSMPPRVQFAAGAVAVLTTVFFVLRWIAGFWMSDDEEEREVVHSTK
jgi:hypothetical protein